MEVILRRQRGAQPPMKLWLRDSDDAPFVQISVAAHYDPRVQERLVRPPLPKRLPQEDKRPDFDDPARHIGLAVKNYDVGGTGAGWIDQLQFDFLYVGER